MNAELFGALLTTMTEYGGNRLLDTAAMNDLLAHFGKAAELWAKLESAPDEGDDAWC